jgi:hypothetical protein
MDTITYFDYFCCSLMIAAFVFGVHRYTRSLDRRLLLSPLVLVILVAGIDGLGHYIVATHPDALAALQTRLAEAVNDPSHPRLNLFSFIPLAAIPALFAFRRR